MKDSLTRLVLGSWGSNALTRLPESVCALEKLNLLWLANNQLEALPPAIGNLKNLSYFSAENNRLTTMPESFFDLSPFWLKQEFSFHDNPIEEALMKSYKKRINQGYKREMASR